MRQLAYGNSKSNEFDSVDVVLFLNGIPIVTMELKNNLTGQRTAHAVKQYKEDRDPKELLFQPNRRAIVHFALDSETVEMCTWLKGKSSFFLPFNKGNGMSGGGNPVNENGYRTEYLYTNVLAPDSLLDIIQRFVRVDYKEDSKRRKVMDKVDLSALPPAGCRAQADCSRQGERPWQQLPHPALGRFRQVQLDRLARAPPAIAARQ